MGTAKRLHAAGTCVAFQALKFGANFSSALITEIAVLLQRCTNHIFQLRRKRTVQLRRRGGISIQNAIEDHSRSVALERQLGRSHLIEDGSEREQVATRVEFLPTGLLRGHVSN